MRLIVNNPTSADPVIGVRWCLSKEELNDVNSYATTDASDTLRILLVVAYERGGEDRYVLPLSDVMTFISFRQPGNHKLLAAVGKYNDYMEKKILAKVSFRHYDMVLLRDGTITTFYDRVNICRPATDTLVSVSEEHFPPEPWKWVRKIADMGFSYPSQDQCQLRRRKISIPFKLVGLGFWFVCTTILRFLIASIMSTGTARKVSWSAVIHPWSMDLFDVTKHVPYFWFTESWIRRDSDGNNRNKAWLILHPWIWMLAFSVLTVIKLVTKESYLHLLWKFFYLLALAFINGGWILVPIILVIFGFIFFVTYVSSNEWINKRTVARHVKYKAKMKESQELLTCQTGLQPDPATIPIRNQSIRLIYLDVKRRVCKPFAN